MTSTTTRPPTICLTNLPERERKFFDMCCRQAGVQPTSRQLAGYIKGTGSAAAYALRTGGRCRIHATARVFGRCFPKKAPKA